MSPAQMRYLVPMRQIAERLKLDEKQEKRVSNALDVLEDRR